MKTPTPAEAITNKADVVVLAWRRMQGEPFVKVHPILFLAGPHLLAVGGDRLFLAMGWPGARRCVHGPTGLPIAYAPAGATAGVIAQLQAQGWRSPLIFYAEQT